MRIRIPQSLRSLVVFGMKVGGAGLAFILNIAITRVIGIHDAGVFFIAFSLTTILYAVARFGLGYTTYRSIAEAAIEEGVPRVRQTANSVVLLVSAISIVIAITVIASADLLSHWLFGSSEGVAVLILLALTIPLYCIGSIFSEILKGLRRPIGYALFENIIIKACAVPIVLWLGVSLGLVGAGWAMLVANAVGLVVVTLLTVSVLRGFPAATRAHVDNLPTLLSTTALFAVVSLSTVLSQWLGPLIVGQVLTPSDAAIFFTAYRTSAVLEFVVISIVSVAGPAFVAANSLGGIKSVLKLAKPEALKALGAVLLLAVPAAIFASPLMTMYGADFARGDNALRALILFQVINAPLGVYNAAVIALKREKAMAVLAPVSAILVAVLSYTFTLQWGVLGAAVGVGLSMMTYNLMVYAILHLGKSKIR